jgi:hypothetical protein
MRILTVILTLFVLIQYSCSNSNNDKLLLYLDNLRIQLNEAEMRYSNFDSTTISNIRNSVKTTCKRIRNADDTLVNSTIIPYSHIDKSIKQILRMDVRIKMDIKKSRVQIDDLYHDLENNLVDSIPLLMYIDDETNAVMAVIEKMEYNFQRSLSEVQEYDSLHPIIENQLNRTY